MKASTVFFGLLMAIAGVMIYFEAQPAPQRPRPQPKKTSESPSAVAPDPPAPPVEVQVPKPALARQPEAEPMAPSPSPSPLQWYSARRVSVMSDTGVSSVPAGVEVSRVNDTEILYENKRFKVTPGDLTSDPLVAAEILAKIDAAELVHQQQRENLVQAEQANVAFAQTQEHERKIARRQQINSAIGVIDRQISALQHKINNERNAESLAAASNKISGRGAIISRCEQAIAKLQTERMRLLTMD